MGLLYNLARMTTATAGTGTITLGSAVSGFLTFAGAGVANSDVVSYGIMDGANSEVGTGTYTSAGTTLTRTVTKSTNSNTAISLSGSAQVYITARAEDLYVIPATTPPTISSVGIINVANATDATSTSAAALTVVGGIGVAKSIVVGGTVGAGAASPSAGVVLYVRTGTDNNLEVSNSTGVAVQTLNNARNAYRQLDFTGNPINFLNSGNQGLQIGTNNSIVIGSAALVTSAVDGFLYIESCAGTPTGVPTTYTGRVPTVYDTTNNKFYVYNGAWKGVTLA